MGDNDAESGSDEDDEALPELEAVAPGRLDLPRRGLRRHRAAGRAARAPGAGGLMVKVIQVADDGTEKAAIEVDDFTMEVIYSGMAEMLRDAAAARRPSASRRPPASAARRRQRRQRVLEPSAATDRFDACAARSLPAAPGRGVGQGAKGCAATLKRHAHLPGGHPRLPPGPRRG